jgi:hypothetical protein
MKRILNISLLLLLATISSIKSQTVVLDGEIRPRVEYRDGYSTPLTSSADPGISTQQRTRLSFAYNSGVLNTLVTLQDARVFGQNSTSSSTATVGIYEAWADVLLAPGLSFKIGRQGIKYDDARLFSAPAWSNTGTAHDMALLKYNINDLQIHLATAYNNKSAISSEAFYTPGTDGAKYRMMNFLWLTNPVTDYLSLSALLVDEALQDTVGIGSAYKKTGYNHALTFGGNLKFQKEKFPLSALATAYFQSGKNYQGKDMTGKLLALKLDYKLTENYGLSLGTDYLSGDNNGTTDGTQSNFKKLYGADHTFNGYMDYWNTPLDQGLLDYYATATAKVGKALNLEAGYHLFNSEYSGTKTINKVKESFGKDLGSELDLLVTYKINSTATVQGGYCFYFDTKNTLVAKGISASADIRNPQWAYVMFTFKPTFLNTATAK